MHETVQGQKAYASLGEISETVDLAVVATPAGTIPDIVEACGEHGIKMMLILSAGFRESGAEGRQLEDRVTGLIRHYGIRLMGPNCLGIIRPDKHLNITFGHNAARPGNLAFVSQSGAICTAILDWAEMNDIGFSAVVSTGIALKVGRHLAGAEASMSHTGALVGSNETFSAALSRSGVLQVESIGQLFAAAKALSSSHFREASERLVIITNGGGPGVMAADRATDRGIELSALSPETITALNGRITGGLVPRQSRWTSSEMQHRSVTGQRLTSVLRTPVWMAPLSFSRPRP